MTSNPWLSYKCEKKRVIWMPHNEVGFHFGFCGVFHGWNHGLAISHSICEVHQSTVSRYSKFWSPKYIWQYITLSYILFISQKIQEIGFRWRNKSRVSMWQRSTIDFRRSFVRYGFDSNGVWTSEKCRGRSTQQKQVKLWIFALKTLSFEF